jgi:biopolymer transport protein ExbB
MAATWTTTALAPLVQPAAAPGPNFGLWSLFSQSFDLFTVALLAGSLVGMAWVVRAILELREPRILPRGSMATLKDLASRGKLAELRAETRDDAGFLPQTVAAALGAPPGARRQAAELVASEQCARLFRLIEPLNVIGTLGPLVGLAGTVWGMILAFTSLGETGGQAGAADLSLGISKALFHTLLGLLLAIPCLLTYGLYRGLVDRICNRGMIAAGEIVDQLERLDASGADSGQGPAGVAAPSAASGNGAPMHPAGAAAGAR